MRPPPPIALALPLVLAFPAAARAQAFLPHAVCYLWDRSLLALHAVTDSLIGLSYVAISATLAYLVHRARRDIPFHLIVVAFGVFIVACGATHLMEVWTLWVPRYWLSGAVKVLTAVASVATALALPPLVPRALALVAAARAARQHEGTLRESEARYRALLASAPDGIVIAAEDGRIVLVNEQGEALFGYGPGELIGEPVERLLPERMRDAHVEHRARYHAEPRARGMGMGRDLRGLRKDGTEFPAEISLSPVRTVEGLLVITVIRDVTERRALEAQRQQLLREQLARAEAEAAERRAAFLSEAAALLSSSLEYEQTLGQLTRVLVPRLADVCALDMVEGSTLRRLAVAHVDPSQEPLVRSLRDRYGFNPAAASGVPRVVRTREAAFVRQVTDADLEAAATHPDQLALLRSLGIRSWIIVPLLARGRVLGTITLVMATSGRLFEDADLELARELAQRAAIAIDNADLYRAAQAANRAKDEFLATLSHELRTPLNAVYGWARMLREKALPPETAARALASIERNAEAQVQLIDDLLDVSRIVAGKMRLQVRPTDPIAVVQAALDVVQPSVEARSLRVRTVFDPAAGPVMGDPDRLQQVVWNLLTNAVKFTPKEGRIDVHVLRVNSHVEIVVSDTGEGIDPAVLPHIFDRFRQADSTPTRGHGGLGIGLALVRHLVELHGGSVAATSAGIGKGARFIVRLPLAIADLRTPEERQHPTARTAALVWPGRQRLDGVRLLVVDDDRDSLELVRTILAEAGGQVEPAASAAEALERVAAGTFDVIVSDIEMPGQDGYALLRRLREELPTRAVPVIALTAYGRVEDRVRALSAGFALHIAKPVDPAELLAAVANVVRR